jgi:hypothetical protein
MIKNKIRAILSGTSLTEKEFDECTRELLNLFSVIKRALLTVKQAKISCKLCNGKGHLSMKMEDGLYYVIDCPKCIAEI